LIEDRYFIDSKTTKQKERKKERKETKNADKWGEKEERKGLNN
jgi:hypothetical protein